MSTVLRSTSASLRILLAGCIDYAGLFPPTSLDMATSVANYARYRTHPQSWALGRFVLPATRLDDFLTARQVVPVKEGDAASEPWRLSAILSADVIPELAAVDRFNRMECGGVVESIEARVSAAEEMTSIRIHQPSDTLAFFEIPPDRAAELLPLIGRGGGCAKLRSGGVSAEAIPSVETIAAFVARCAALDVPFKATAGLHHPLRSMAPLTCDADSARATMHGFLNFFTSAAIAWSGRHAEESTPRATLAASIEASLETCLADMECAHWNFTDDALTWSGNAAPIRIEAETLAQVRSRFALSFGSCSFEEPIGDLRRLGLL